MLKRTRSSLSLGLSESVLSLLHCQGGRASFASVLAERTLPNTNEFNNCVTLKILLNEMLGEAKRSGLPVSVILADRWVRYFMVTPPLDARAMEDCRSAIAMRFKSLYGESMDAWHLAADWDARKPFLACTMPKALFAVLQETADEHKLTLTGVMPQFIANLNRWRKQLKDTEWFATILDQHMTLGIIDIANPGRLTAVLSTTLSENALQSRTWLTEYATREAMRMNWSAPQQIKLCGEVPESWLGTSAGKINCIRLDQDIGIRPMNAGIVLASCGARR